MIVRCPQCGAPVVSIDGIVAPFAFEPPLDAADLPGHGKIDIKRLSPPVAPDTGGDMSCGESPARPDESRIARIARALEELQRAFSAATVPKAGNAGNAPTSQP